MTSDTEERPEPAEASSHGPSFPAAPRAIRLVVFACVVLAGSTAAAWWFTRATPSVDAAAAAPAGEHDHGAVASTALPGTPVMLSADAARRIGVTYAVAERALLGREIRTVGFVTFDETRVKTITPKVDGYVEELYVATTGEAVREHDPLLRIYSPMLVTAQEELLLAAKLVKDVTDTGRNPIGGGRDAARDADELLNAARRRLRYWDVPAEDIARVEASGEVTKTIMLRSPLHGVVTQRNVLAGQRVMAGDALFQVADLRTVWVEGEVFERDLSAVRRGLSVTIEIEALNGRTWEGRIVFVSPVLSSDTRTARVRVALSNAGLILKPGMFATMHIQGATRRDGITVPRSAVLMTGERALVFVRDSNAMLSARKVDVGVTEGDRTEIRRGLAAGETVVASATFLIDAESNLTSAVGAMLNMPGMKSPYPNAPATKPPAMAMPEHTP